MIIGTLGISLYPARQIKNLPAHKSMLDISEIIFQTCKTYLIQQGKFLMMLFAIIAGGDDVLLRRFAAQERRHAALLCWPLPWWAWAVRTGWPGTASASTPTPIPAPPSPRSAASRGTWSTFRCGPACRSVCS